MEKRPDQISPISIALLVGVAVFWIVWLLRSLSTAFAMATAAAVVTWGTSTWLESKQKITTFQGAVSTTLSERNYKFQEKQLIPLVAAVLVWGVSKFLVGQFLGVMVGGMVGCILYNRFEEREKMRLEEERRKKRVEQVVTGVLGFGAAAGAAALAAWGISKSFDSGESSGGYRYSDAEEEKDKMMKAPGRDYFMPRKDFETNPSQYFRHLRGK